MSNYRTGGYAASYLDQPRNAYNSLSKNYGYSLRNAVLDDDHNHGQIEFMLENERKKFKQAKQKFQHDLDSQRKLRIEFENKLIKLKDQFSRKQVTLSELQFKINNLLHQNQDLVIENQRIRSEIVRLQDAYGGKIHELQGRLNMQTKNYDDMTNQYNLQFQKFKKQGQEYIEQITFDYERKIKNLQQKVKLSQNAKRELALQNKKLNDILITNKLAFEEQIRDLKNRARQQQIKKTQQITKSFDQKLKMIDDSKQSLVRKNSELLRLLQEKDREIQQVQSQKSQQLSRLRQQCSDFTQQITHLNYIINKLKSQVSEKDNLLGRSYADNDGQVQVLRQQLQLKKQEVFQLSSTAKDLRIALKNSQNEWQGKRRDLIQRSNHFERQGKKYKQEYQRICQVLKSKINDTISAVSYKR